MESNYPDIIGTILIGLGATLTSDLWALFLNRAFNVAAANYCYVGRWFRYMPAGTFKHFDIAATPRKRAECATGWIAHYVIGVIFASILVSVATGRWLESPTLFPAMMVGVATVVFPLFIMQPCFGLGIAASNSPKPAQARLKSLMTHAVFGVGLYIAALLVSIVFYTRP